MTRAVIGLDIGTTTVKAVAISENGDVIGRGTSSPLTMAGESAGSSEQDPAEILEAVHVAIAGVIRSATPTHTVVGMAMAAQSGSVVGLDSDDEPLTGLVTWMDTRAEKIVGRWKADGTAERVRSISGWDVGCGLGLSTLAWFAENSGDTFASVARWASADAYVAHALTGVWRTNPSNAAGMQFIDVATSTWSDELCDLAGTKPAELSEIVPCGSVVGELNDVTRHKTGLRTPITLVAGGHDQSCTALALGIIEPGRCLLATGTAWVLTTVLGAESWADSTAATSPAPTSMNISRHVSPDRLTASAYLGGFGASMQWWSQMASDESGQTTSIEALGSEVAADRPGVGDLTFLVTGRDASGKPAPGAGVFVGADEHIDRAQRTRAVMETAAGAADTVLGELDALSSLTMVGGATRGGAWPQIVADVTGRTVGVAKDDSLPATAAAAMAGISLGLFVDATAAFDAIGVELEFVSPRSGTHHEHDSPDVGGVSGSRRGLLPTRFASQETST